MEQRNNIRTVDEGIISSTKGGNVNTQRCASTPGNHLRINQHSIVSRSNGISRTEALRQDRMIVQEAEEQLKSEERNFRISSAIERALTFPGSTGAGPAAFDEAVQYLLGSKRFENEIMSEKYAQRFAEIIKEKDRGYQEKPDAPEYRTAPTKTKAGVL